MRLPDGYYDDARVRKLADAFRSACRELGLDPGDSDQDTRDRIARLVFAADREAGPHADDSEIAHRTVSRFRSDCAAGADTLHGSQV